MDRRIPEYQEALLYQHIRLREFDRSEPSRLVRNEANVGLAASHGVDHHRGAGNRLEVERLANFLGEFAGEIKRYATHFAGVSIANCLCRIGGQIGCAQRARRRDVGLRICDGYSGNQKSCRPNRFHDTPL